GVADARDGRKKRINGNHADGLIGLFVLVTGQETAADFNFEFHLEFSLLVQRADVLVGIDEFDVLIELNVGGRNRAFFVYRKQQHLRVARVGFKEDLFEVQDDVGDILNDTFDGGELMHGAVHLDRADSCALEGGEQHSAQGVADG